MDSRNNKKSNPSIKDIDYTCWKHIFEIYEKDTGFQNDTVRKIRKMVDVHVTTGILDRASKRKTSPNSFRTFSMLGDSIFQHHVYNNFLLSGSFKSSPFSILSCHQHTHMKSIIASNVVLGLVYDILKLDLWFNVTGGTFQSKSEDTGSENPMRRIEEKGDTLEAILAELQRVTEPEAKETFDLFMKLMFNVGLEFYYIRNLYQAKGSLELKVINTKANVRDPVKPARGRRGGRNQPQRGRGGRNQPQRGRGGASRGRHRKNMESRDVVVEKKKKVKATPTPMEVARKMSKQAKKEIGKKVDPMEAVREMSMQAVKEIKKDEGKGEMEKKRATHPHGARASAAKPKPKPVNVKSRTMENPKPPQKQPEPAVKVNPKPNPQDGKPVVVESEAPPVGPPAIPTIFDTQGEYIDGSREPEQKWVNTAMDAIGGLVVMCAHELGTSKIGDLATYGMQKYNLVKRMFNKVELMRLSPLELFSKSNDGVVYVRVKDHYKELAFERAGAGDSLEEMEHNFDAIVLYFIVRSIFAGRFINLVDLEKRIGDRLGINPRVLLPFVKKNPYYFKLGDDPMSKGRCVSLADERFFQTKTIPEKNNPTAKKMNTENRVRHVKSCMASKFIKQFDPELRMSRMELKRRGKRKKHHLLVPKKTAQPSSSSQSSQSQKKGHGGSTTDTSNNTSSRNSSRELEQPVAPKTKEVEYVVLRDVLPLLLDRTEKDKILFDEHKFAEYLFSHRKIRTDGLYFREIQDYCLQNFQCELEHQDIRDFVTKHSYLYYIPHREMRVMKHKFNLDKVRTKIRSLPNDIELQDLRRMLEKKPFLSKLPNGFRYINEIIRASKYFSYHEVNTETSLNVFFKVHPLYRRFDEFILERTVSSGGLRDPRTPTDPRRRVMEFGSLCNNLSEIYSASVREIRDMIAAHPFMFALVKNVETSTEAMTRFATVKVASALDCEKFDAELEKVKVLQKRGKLKEGAIVGERILLNYPNVDRGRKADVLYYLAYISYHLKNYTRTIETGLSQIKTMDKLGDNNTFTVYRLIYFSLGKSGRSSKRPEWLTKMKRYIRRSEQEFPEMDFSLWWTRIGVKKKKVLSDGN